MFFYRPDALPAAQPTASKHWRQLIQYTINQYTWKISERPACTDKVASASCCWWSDFQCFAPDPRLVHSTDPEPQSWSLCLVPQTDLDWWNLPTVKCSTVHEIHWKQLHFRLACLFQVSSSESEPSVQEVKQVFRMLYLSISWQHQRTKEVKIMMSTAQNHTMDRILLEPSTDSWGHGCHTIYTSSLTPVPSRQEHSHLVMSHCICVS